MGVTAEWWCRAQAGEGATMQEQRMEGISGERDAGEKRRQRGMQVQEGL